MKGTFIRKNDLVLMVAVLSVAGALLLFPGKPGKSVTVSIDGKEVETLFCEDRAFDKTYETKAGSLTLTVTSSGVYVKEADCRDKICQKTGCISQSGESIVCAPLGICVTVDGEKTQDAVTG
ncbi:MAG: NusG domain II-containing protein [Clostridia bacterium]|nr:NusG domain II-containing protein [Clostridia bacterium]